jgi:two-component system sensor histidine kinase UhpB
MAIEMKRGSLYERVFLLNATILVVATLVVAVTPATVSFPVELTEAIVLAGGLAAILVVNAFVLRAAFAPLERLMQLMRHVQPDRPGERLEASGPREVRELVVVFNDMLDRLERERRESWRQALLAQEGERRRVAQELHDDVGQALTGVLLRLESLARKAPEERSPTWASARRSPLWRAGSRRNRACASRIGSPSAPTMSTRSPSSSSIALPRRA